MFSLKKETYFHAGSDKIGFRWIQSRLAELDIFAGHLGRRRKYC